MLCKNRNSSIDFSCCNNFSVMIQLLFTVVTTEMVLIMILLFKTPLRKMTISCLDRVKRGRGPVVVKTIGGTVFVVLLSSVYSMLNIQKRTMDDGAANATDQVLMAKYLLELSLMGFSLFLGLMLDRLHNYIRELRLLRKDMEAVKKQNRGAEDMKNEILEENKTLVNDITSLKAKVNRLETECEAKTKEVIAGEANVMALKKQSEGLLLEYDRLLEDNQNRWNQSQSIDHSLSRSDYKKNR